MHRHKSSKYQITRVRSKVWSLDRFECYTSACGRSISRRYLGHVDYIAPVTRWNSTRYRPGIKYVIARQTSGMFEPRSICERQSCATRYRRVSFTKIPQSVYCSFTVGARPTPTVIVLTVRVVCQHEFLSTTHIYTIMHSHIKVTFDGVFFLSIM